MRGARGWLMGVALGCATAPEEAPLGAPANACAGAVTVTITDSARGHATWTPACGAYGVIVSQAVPVDPSGTVHWALVPQSDLIRPPLRYGTPPAGARVASRPVSLVSGRWYRLSVLGAATVGLAGSLEWPVP